MPYSFFEIERRKSWIILLLFAFLVVLYFSCCFSVWVIVKGILPVVFERSVAFVEGGSARVRFAALTTREISVIFTISLVVAIFHWILSQIRVIDKILGAINAEPLNPGDKYHVLLKNVIEEASVACGGIQFEPCVIPAGAINAFSISDFSGRKVIGVTEGLLGKFNRRQVQAVIGHEVAHILRGDSLFATVSSSLFELYSTILEKLSKAIANSGILGFQIIVMVIFALVFISDCLTYLINIFMSRQAEYRADAVAVRVTRDPLSLAEALYLISQSRMTDKIPGDKLSSIFIVSPRYKKIDEEEGLWADMFSTHPPIRKRINILLEIAGIDENTLKSALNAEMIKPGDQETPAISSDNKWYVEGPGNEWTGPLGISEIINLDWLRPYSSVRRGEEEKVISAYEDSELKQLFKPASGGAPSQLSCPLCFQGMEEVDYEGNMVDRCPSCRGVFLSRGVLVRILTRQEKGFSPELVKQAEAVIEQSIKKQFEMPALDKKTLTDCPKCGKKMKKLYFSWSLDTGIPEDEAIARQIGLVNLVVDKCAWCDSMWLSHNELEILQYIYEKYQ
jgi:heat shock protein HtpX